MPAVVVTWQRSCFSGLQDKEEQFVVVVFFYSKKNNCMHDRHLELVRIRLQNSRFLISEGAKGRKRDPRV